MKMRRLLFLQLVIFIPFASYSQIDEAQLRQMRDSLDHLLVVNPSASAILVKRGDLELYTFNSLLSTNRFNDRSGNNASFTGSSHLLSSLLQLNYGFSRNRRFNAGLDFSYTAYKTDQIREEPFTAIFGDGVVAGLTYAGVRVRFQPIKKLNRFNMQSYVWFPVADETKGRILNATDIIWGNTFFYYKYLTDKVAVFTQLNISLSLPGNQSAENTTSVNVPATVSFSYAASRKSIFFVSGSYARLNTDVSTFFEGADSDYVMAGAGFQRLISRKFFFNASYSTTVMSRNFGVWNGGVIGVRAIL